jgi:hypothetical protein
MKLRIVQLPPFPRHLIPLRSKYSSQNPVIKHPQSKQYGDKFVNSPEYIHRSQDHILLIVRVNCKPSDHKTIFNILRHTRVFIQESIYCRIYQPQQNQSIRRKVKKSTALTEINTMAHRTSLFRITHIRTTSRWTRAWDNISWTHADNVHRQELYKPVHGTIVK